MMLVSMFVEQCAKLVAQEVSQVALGVVLAQAERTVGAWERLVHERQRTAHMLRMEPLLMAYLDQRVASLQADLSTAHHVRLALMRLYVRAEAPAELEQLERLYARLEASRVATLAVATQLDQLRLDS